MLEIKGITDKQGKAKDKELNNIKEKHGSAYGYFHYQVMVGYPFIFWYKDDDNGLRSSTVEKYEYVEKDKLHIITTRNSIYYILEV